MTPLLTLAHRQLIRRLLRYASVSAISTVTSLIVLGVLVGVVGLPALWANMIAIAIGTVPSFELNRRWVWSAGGEGPRLAQVLPFCVLSLSGLVVSSLAVHVAASLMQGDGRLLRTIAVEGANVLAYGSLWVIQFVLCDRVLFPAVPALPPPRGDVYAATRGATRRVEAVTDEA